MSPLTRAPSLRRLGALTVVVVLVAALATWLTVRDDAVGTQPHNPLPPPPTAPALPGRVADTIGVLSFNAYWHLRPRHAHADDARLAPRNGIDLVGWQESRPGDFSELYPQFHEDGWQTWHHEAVEGPHGLAVSWRTTTFDLVDVGWEEAHRNAGPRETAAPFPIRWIVTAQFRHRATGRTVTLINTHLNQAIQDGDGLRHNLNVRFAKRHLRMLARTWRKAPGDLVVGTGDYNFDHAADQRGRPAGGITDTIGRQVVSSYDVLGTTNLAPTRDRRWIDYVFVARRSLKDNGGVAQFATHRTVAGLRSDHRALLARLRVYAR